MVGDCSIGAHSALRRIFEIVSMIHARIAHSNIQIEAINELTTWLAQAPWPRGHEVERLSVIGNKRSQRQAKWAVDIWPKVFGRAPW